MNVTVTVTVSRLRLVPIGAFEFTVSFASFMLGDPRFPSGAMTTLEEKIATSGPQTKPDFSTSGECYCSAFPYWHFPSALNT